jgi:hypothetical protein
MPRYNWRPPSGLPDYQSPAPVMVDDDDQEPAESAPVRALHPVERVVFATGQVVHLRWEDAPSVFCGRVSQYGVRLARGRGRVCKQCLEYPAAIPALNDPGSYDPPAGFERVRWPAPADQLVHLRRQGQTPSVAVFVAVLCCWGAAPLEPVGSDVGPLCLKCITRADDVSRLAASRQ